MELGRILIIVWGYREKSIGKWCLNGGVSRSRVILKCFDSQFLRLFISRSYHPLVFPHFILESTFDIPPRFELKYQGQSSIL